MHARPHNAPEKVPGLKPRKFDWSVFDSMPRHLKEICWYSNNPVHISKPNPHSDYAEARAKMREGERKQTLLTYGPDHPQAGLPAGGVPPLSRGACHPVKREGTNQMKTYAFDFTKQCIKAYECKQDARNAGNGTHLASTPEEFLEFRVTAHEITALYNKLVPDAQIKGFHDKATAAKRMLALAEAKAQHVASTLAEPQKEAETMAKAAKKTAKKEATKTKTPRAKKEEGGSRTNKFTGARLVPTLDANPCREGGKVGQAMALIYATKRGISYDDYVASGYPQRYLYKALRKGQIAVQ